MLNIKDFAEIAAKLEAARAEAAETGNWAIDDEANQSLTGPGVGIWYDYDNHEVKIANGWKADEAGNIVKQ